MASTLKDQNRLGLWAVTAGNLLLFAVLSRPAGVLSGDLGDLARDWGPILPAGLGLIVVGVLNHQIDAIAKARLVFWRIHDPLPGSAAFTRWGPSDARVDMDTLQRKFGPLPTDAKAQNALWYKLYKSVESEAAVEQAHREYLFTRDYCFLATLMLIGLGALAIITFASVGNVMLYLLILTAQFLMTGQAARVHGRRLISTVLATASAKGA